MILQSVKVGQRYVLDSDQTLYRPNTPPCPTVTSRALTHWAELVLTSWPLALDASAAAAALLTCEVQRQHTRTHVCLQQRDCVFFFNYCHYYLPQTVQVHQLVVSPKPNPLPSSCFHLCRGREGWLRGKVGGKRYRHTRGLVATSFMRRRRSAKTVSNQCLPAAIYIQRVLMSRRQSNVIAATDSAVCSQILAVPPRLTS